jgi:hypothetical protein
MVMKYNVQKWSVNLAGILVSVYFPLQYGRRKWEMYDIAEYRLEHKRYVSGEWWDTPGMT